MIAAIDVAEITQIGKLPGDVLPTAAAEQKAALRIGARGLEKKFMHPRFAIRQAIAEKREARIEARIRRDGKMAGGVQRIVNWHAFLGAEP